MTAATRAAAEEGEAEEGEAEEARSCERFRDRWEAAVRRNAGGSLPPPGFWRPPYSPTNWSLQW